MKKQKRIQKTVVMLICFSMAFTSLGVFAGPLMAKGGGSILDVAEELLGLKAPNDAALKTDEKDLQPEREKNVVLKAEDSGKKLMIFKTTRYSTDPKNPFANDRYNFTAQELDELTREGYKLQDILKADELGNKTGTNPREVLKIMKETRKEAPQPGEAKKTAGLAALASAEDYEKATAADWKQVEDVISARRDDRLMRSMEKVFPEEVKQLEASGLSKNAQTRLLIRYNNGEGATIDELIQTEKTGKSDKTLSASAAQVNSVASGKRKGSAERLKRLKLTEAQADGLTELELARLEEISKETGIPAAKLLEKASGTKGGRK
ncbi:MAG: hypothetical protein ACM3QZ_08130 [Solirubrobacterales bacterium]